MVRAVEPLIVQPMYIESNRLAPFKLRGSDVNVVLDLMIHDIDIIQSIVAADIKRIDANGLMVLSNMIDMANARIEFANGCIANVTASRISMRRERQLKIFQPENYITLDLDNKTLGFHQKSISKINPRTPEITCEEQAFEQGDPLNAQIENFLSAIQNHQAPLVSGEAGKRALDTAIKITQIVHARHAIKPVRN